MSTSKPIPKFLIYKSARRYVKKNHMYLETNLTWVYAQSFLKSGKRATADILVCVILARLKFIATPTMLLSLANWALSMPVEISPIRMGKKIKMIPRVCSFYRQHKRSAHDLSTQLNLRKYAGLGGFVHKVYKEVISGLFFPQESLRFTQHALVYLAGFFNLRYLSKRWF